MKTPDRGFYAESFRYDRKDKIWTAPEGTVLVSLGGFEPPTHSLEGCCSIQLSYRPMRRQTIYRQD